MIKICDSHCHLQDRKFSGDLERTINSAKDRGVSCIIVPGWDRQSSIGAIEVAKKYEGVYAAVGIHPHDAKTYNEDAKREISGYTKKEKVIAIGEIGLDYYRDLSPRDTQREVFKKQLAIAEENNLPVIIHTRNSMNEAIELVSEFNIRGVFHSFTKEAKVANKIIALGFYIGIGGVVTFENSMLSREVKYIPLERILLETDAPYMTPHPHRGKRNEPAYTVHVLEKIAKIKSIPLEEVAEVTYENTKNLFKY